MLLPHFKFRRCAENKTLVGKQSIPLILYAESKTAALTGAAVPVLFDSFASLAPFAVNPHYIFCARNPRPRDLSPV